MNNVTRIYLHQIFEWWYFRKYGTSFIEHVSLSHLGPLLGSSDSTPQNTQQNVAGALYKQTLSGSSIYVCVWREKHISFTHVLDKHDMSFMT